jgi:two-component system nitrogen regulation response regulator GlnG
MNQENLPSPLVLVVDDEALIRWALSEGLTECGYKVCQAATGAEARAVLAAHAHTPLVILLDLRLPDVADLSLLRDVRRARPDAPVVMMTAHGTSDDEQEATRLGVYRFMGKPFDVAEMIRLVGDAWRAKGPAPLE